MIVTRQCEECDKDFETRDFSSRKGRGRYCSRSCAAKGKGRSFRKPPNTECSYCGNPIRRTPSKAKNSKSGLFFCNRACKAAAQRIGGLKAIMPSHYGTGESEYRRIAFAHHPYRCADCDWNEEPAILHVHHVNLDRADNRPENLRILCGRCHDWTHFRSKTGKWKRRFPN